MSRAPCWIRLVAAIVTIATLVSGVLSYLGRPGAHPWLSAPLTGPKVRDANAPEMNAPGTGRPDSGPAEANPPDAGDGATEQNSTMDKGSVVILDAFDATAAAVAAMRLDRQVVLCHLRAGLWDPYLPDAARFDARAMGAVTGTGDLSRWLDVRRWDLLSDILTDRIDMCAAKGFDGVAFSAVDGYAHETGFALTSADSDAFRGALMGLAAARGLEVRFIATSRGSHHSEE